MTNVPYDQQRAERQTVEAEAKEKARATFDSLRASRIHQHVRVNLTHGLPVEGFVLTDDLIVIQQRPTTLGGASLSRQPFITLYTEYATLHLSTEAIVYYHDTIPPLQGWRQP
jgi:hypothetical protein